MGALLVILCLGALALAVFSAISVKNMSFSLTSAIPGLLLAFLFFAVFLSYTTVDAGYSAVVTRFGKVNRTFPPGLHFILPFVETAHPISTQTHVVKPDVGASSHDLQQVQTQVTLAYHFDPNYVAYIYTQLADSSDNAVENKVINPAILEAIKATTALYDAQDLIGKRPEVRNGIDSFVSARIGAYHIIAESVSITHFDFSNEYNAAIEAKVTAQQKAEKAQNDLTRIQVEAQQQIAQAKGEAEALRVQKEQITPELLQLRTIEMMREKWNGQLPENYFGGSAPLPMMDVFRNGRKQ
jgi:prohibitin 2